MDILIRKATTHDAEYISLLGRITFDETFGHLFEDRKDLLSYFENTFSVPKITSSLSKKENVFWIAFANQLPVGYAKLKIDSPLDDFPNHKTSQLQKIYVLKDFLALKIGAKLQEELFKEVRKINSEVLWLAILYTNLRAINFYQKYGFKKSSKYYHSIGKENFEFDVMIKEF
ncbi:MAG: GNAT family N-acetyltransferase [Flavobacteriaceae bacterium]|nr:GNAT family N-acetyltransferase [Flavobacteriaceae bacterium]